MPSLREAQSRHAQYYWDMLRQANEFYQQGGESITHGLSLFDLERPNIEAGQTWAAGHSTEDGSAA